MRFLNRDDEKSRLDRFARGRDGGLAVVWGRRRIGKTRLLLEWCASRKGAYAVADQSAADIQRRHIADALDEALPGFAAAEYPSWDALLNRLAADARARSWRGPVVFDEFP